MLRYNDKECVVTGSVVVNVLWWGKVTGKNDYYKYTVIATLKLHCITLLAPYQPCTSKNDLCLALY